MSARAAIAAAALVASNLAATQPVSSIPSNSAGACNLDQLRWTIHCPRN